MTNLLSQKQVRKIKKLLPKIPSTAKNSNKNLINSPSKDNLKRKSSNKKKNNSINKLTILKKLSPQKLKRLSNLTTL